jgi:hypothetical protein
LWQPKVIVDMAPMPRILVSSDRLSLAINGAGVEIKDAPTRRRPIPAHLKNWPQNGPTRL